MVYLLIYIPGGQ